MFVSYIFLLHQILSWVGLWTCSRHRHVPLLELGGAPIGRLESAVGMEPLSLDQLLSPVPPNLLNQKITSDIHLDKIAQSLGNWKAAIAYLGLSEADEEAIEEENAKVDARRLVLCLILYAVAIESR